MSRFSTLLVVRELVVLGTISNRDIRCALLQLIAEGGNPASLKAVDICNKRFLFASHTDSKETIKFIFAKNPRIKILPLLNTDKSLHSLAVNSTRNFIFKENLYSSNTSDIITIAEIGVNHNGDMAVARNLIIAASKCGVSAVKFQIRSCEFYSTDNPSSFDLSSQIVYSELQRTFLSFSQFLDLVCFAKSLGLGVVITPFDELALKTVLSWPIDGLKLASCDLTNIPLLTQLSLTNLPLFISTGMSTEAEIINAFTVLDNNNSNFCFLHCNSTYPTPASDVNLSYIARLKSLTSSVIGYSSHDGCAVPLLIAVSIGARVLEFHITDRQDNIGLDHSSSIPISSLFQIVNQIKSVLTYIGSDNPRLITQGELINRVSLSKSLAYSQDLYKGHILTDDDICLRAPGGGIPYSLSKDIVGKPLLTDVFKGNRVKYYDVRSNSNIQIEVVSSSLFKFHENHLIPGIPVRYHDFMRLHNIFNLSFYEFHMSDSDIELLDYPNANFRGVKLDHLSVHCVEQFNDGFILDLSSSDHSVIDRSFKEIYLLCAHTHNLASLFEISHTPFVVLNPGGATSSIKGKLNDDERRNKQDILFSNLIKIRDQYPSIDFLLQSMPPYPWHLGGKGYHNFLVDYDSIYQASILTGLDICLDVSHTFLASTELNLDFYDLCTSCLPLTKHLHLSDASGRASEGLQIGDGSIDFTRLMNIVLSQGDSDLTFIPEIWQGHEDSGFGFALALEYLSMFLPS